MALPLRLDEQIVLALRQIAQAIDLYSRMLLQQHGLTAPQIAVLRELVQRGEMTPGQLADALHLSQATMAGILGRLERKKYLRRERHPNDRRSVLLRLTSSGMRAVGNAPPLLRDRFLRELAKLPEWQQTDILATLQRVADMMQAPTVDDSPFLFTDQKLAASAPGAAAVTGARAKNRKKRSIIAASRS